MLKSFDFEQDIGVEWFYSDGEGVGGKLRFLAEDFVVEEMGEPRPGEGVMAVKIRHANWESGALKERICRDAGLREGDVTFAGTKDKRAVVTQWITLRRRTMPVLDIEGVEVLEQRSTSCLLRSGEHQGNHFTIRVREIEFTEEEALQRVGACLNELGGGVPNFFGIQRFGAYRPVTHIAGKALLESGAEAAVKTYLGFLGSTQGEEREAREMCCSGSEWKDVLERMPKHLGLERRMLRHLAEHPEDYGGALMKLPAGLIQFLIHSYQSYLFNRILSKRMQAGLPINMPVEGDLIQPPSARLKGGRPRFIPVTAANLSATTKAVSQGKGYVTAALPGADSQMASGEPGEIELAVLEEAGLDAGALEKHFSAKGLPYISSRGTRRPTGLVPANLRHWWEDGLMFSFSLLPGGYATTFLREIMKSPNPLSY